MKNIFVISLFVLVSITITAQESEDKVPHKFEMVKQLKTSSVKSQDRTNTCWSFATTSFIEAELLRMGKGEYDISEMFFVRKNYPLKADQYMRYHGLSNFGEGGLAYDVLSTIRTCGMVPESVYGGKLVDSTKYNHSEMHGVLSSMLESVLNQRGGKISKLWKPAFNSVLDVYLGEVPTEFEFNEKEYTPKSFAESLEFNPDDYVQFTSYTHIPFGKKSNLKIPDNWQNGEYYNIPIDDLVSIMDNSIEMGYSVLWDGDVGKEYFYKSGYAVVPTDDWDDEDSEEPETEKIITQELRQNAFDTFVATDDHLMHVSGIAKNQNGTKFYYTKNSWGSKKGFDGFWYMSESYVRLMTISILVHRDVIPDKIKSEMID